MIPAEGEEWTYLVTSADSGAPKEDDDSSNVVEAGSAHREFYIRTRMFHEEGDEEANIYRGDRAEHGPEDWPTTSSSIFEWQKFWQWQMRQASYGQVDAPKVWQKQMRHPPRPVRVTHSL